MAMNPAGSGYELPCERELEHVWEHLDSAGVDEVDLGADEHERTTAAAAARVGLRLAALDLVVDDIYGVERGERE